MSFTLGRMFVPPHLVPLQYLNNYQNSMITEKLRIFPVSSSA
jgi:hypothetical protein